jgi:enoyl-CoA hydratase/carnithine racemase
MTEVIVERSGPMLEITLNRPEKKNALTRAMYQAVEAAFKTAEDDPAIRVLLLTGAYQSCLEIQCVRGRLSA